MQTVICRTRHLRHVPHGVLLQDVAQRGAQPRGHQRGRPSSGSTPCWPPPSECPRPPRTPSPTPAHMSTGLAGFGGPGGKAHSNTLPWPLPLPTKLMLQCTSTENVTLYNGSRVGNQKPTVMQTKVACCCPPPAIGICHAWYRHFTSTTLGCRHQPRQHHPCRRKDSVIINSAGSAAYLQQAADDGGARDAGNQAQHGEAGRGGQRPVEQAHARA